MKNIKRLSEFLKESHNGMKPDSDLPVGTFLVNYYRGKSQPKSGTIYRIHKVSHSTYHAFEISHHDSKQTGRVIGDNEIVGTEAFKGNENTDWCFEVVDEQFVENLVTQESIEDVIDFLANRPISIQGVEKDKHY